MKNLIVRRALKFRSTGFMFNYSDEGHTDKTSPRGGHTDTYKRPSNYTENYDEYSEGFLHTEGCGRSHNDMY